MGLLSPPEPPQALEPGCDLSACRNGFGKISLELVRAAGLDVGSSDDRPVLEAAYSEWVADDVYLVLREDVISKTTEAVEHLIVVRKGRKRGNDVDVQRVERRLRGIEYVLEPFAGQAGRAVTQLAFVTLTWDTKTCTAAEAWARFPHEWNRYTSRVRRRFGNVRIFRAFEVTDAGYPHVHTLIAFQEYAFADLWVSVDPKKGRAAWRVNDEDRAVLSDWPHFVDVQAVVGKESLRARIKDVLWYVAKGQVQEPGGKGTWNRAVLWYLGKRSWAASRELVRVALLCDLTTRDVSLCTTQTAAWVHFVFLGMVSRGSTELEGGEWVKLYPEPPPWIYAENGLWVPKRAGGRKRRDSAWKELLDLDRFVDVPCRFCHGEGCDMCDGRGFVHGPKVEKPATALRVDLDAPDPAPIAEWADPDETCAELAYVNAAGGASRDDGLGELEAWEDAR